MSNSGSSFYLELTCARPFARRFSDIAELTLARAQSLREGWESRKSAIQQLGNQGGDPTSVDKLKRDTDNYIGERDDERESACTRADPVAVNRLDSCGQDATDGSEGRVAAFN